MTLKTLDNALELLTYFTEQNSSWGVRELAKEVGRSHSVVHRMLITFEKHGFLQKNKDNQKYELGLKFFEYGLVIQDKLKFKDIILPYMKEIAKEMRESVFLNVIDGTDAVCIAIAEGNRPIKFEVTIGSRTPLYAGASCKSIMSFLDKKTQDEIISLGLERFTNFTTVEEKKLKYELEIIKKNGYAHTVGEYTEDVVGISVPIFNHKDEVFASLTIAGPSYRIDEETVTKGTNLLKQGVERIEKHVHEFKFSKNNLI